MSREKHVSITSVGVNRNAVAPFAIYQFAIPLGLMVHESKSTQGSRSGNPGL